MIIRFLIILLIFSILNLSCGSDVPEFDGQKAFQNLLDQCDIGPRDPGSLGHLAGKKYIIESIQDHADTLFLQNFTYCLLYTSPSPRDDISSRMPSSA